MTEWFQCPIFISNLNLSICPPFYWVKSGVKLCLNLCVLPPLGNCASCFFYLIIWGLKMWRSRCHGQSFLKTLFQKVLVSVMHIAWTGWYFALNWKRYRSVPLWVKTLRFLETKKNPETLFNKSRILPLLEFHFLEKPRQNPNWSDFSGFSPFTTDGLNGVYFFNYVMGDLHLVNCCFVEMLSSYFF